MKYLYSQTGRVTETQPEEEEDAADLDDGAEDDDEAEDKGFVRDPTIGLPVNDPSLRRTSQAALLRTAGLMSPPSGRPTRHLVVSSPRPRPPCRRAVGDRHRHAEG